jgi:hypothetical protein
VSKTLPRSRGLSSSGEALEVEHASVGRREERRVRAGGDLRHLLEQLHVLARLVEVVVADERAEGRAAEDAVLLLVDLLEQRALVELRARAAGR